MKYNHVYLLKFKFKETLHGIKLDKRVQCTSMQIILQGMHVVYKYWGNPWPVSPYIPAHQVDVTLVKQSTYTRPSSLTEHLCIAECWLF